MRGEQCVAFYTQIRAVPESLVQECNLELHILPTVSVGRMEVSRSIDGLDLAGFPYQR